MVCPDPMALAILMAPAPGGDQMAETLEDVSALRAPVLLLVAENDLYQADHVQIVKDVKDALSTAGKPFSNVTYPPFDADHDGVITADDDGHELFWEVHPEGGVSYWEDVLAFLFTQLADIECVHTLAACLASAVR